MVDNVKEYRIQQQNFINNFNLNKVDINEVTQVSLIESLLTKGVKSLLPPDTDGKVPEFGIFYVDSSEETSPLSTSDMMNLFISKKYDESVLKITNREIAHLISFVKFARVPKNGSQLLYEQASEISFSSRYSSQSLESVTKDNYYSAGLSSLKVDVISNTGAYYAYKISMSLFFQNAAVLINNNLYKQLLTVPTKDPNSQPVAYTLLIGWATPQIVGDIPENLKIFYEEKLALIVALTTYNLSFNPDGSVVLNLDFIGAAETETNSLNADCLVNKFDFQNLIKDFEEKIKRNSEDIESYENEYKEFKSQVQSQINQLQNELKDAKDNQERDKINKKIESLQDSVKTDKIPDDISKLNEIIDKKMKDPVFRGNYKMFNEGELRQIILSDVHLNSIGLGKAKGIDYFVIAKSILINKNNELENQVESLRYTTIMPRLYERSGIFNGELIFKTSQKNSFIEFKPKFSLKKQQNSNVSTFGVHKNILYRFKTGAKSSYAQTTDLSSAEKELIDLYTKANIINEGNQFRGTDEELTERIKNGESLQYGYITFNYFFLGDLVSILTENMYSNMASGEKDETPMESKKIVLGTIDVFKNETEKVTLDLAYFPISYNLFSSWFLKNIVSKNVKNYPFDRFIKELMNDCVLSSIQHVPEWQSKFKYSLAPSFTINKTYSDRTIELTYTDLPSIVNFNINRITPTNIIENFDEKGRVFVGDYDINAKLYQHLFIYGQSSHTSLAGGYEENLRRGIFHFFVGSTTGIAKDIKFVPINNTSRQSAQIINAMNEQDGKPYDEKFNVIQRYDVNITCIGFQYFKPGQIIYVDTTLLGFGKSTERGSVSRMFTLGGYYLVTSVSHNFEGNDFTTNIIAKFENYGRS